jgi:hypothetical protein
MVNIQYQEHKMKRQLFCFFFIEKFARDPIIPTRPDHGAGTPHDSTITRARIAHHAKRTEKLVVETSLLPTE